jgi:CRP-like cAMP-binding protein
VEPGSTIGEAAVLLNQAHTFSARALTPVHVYVLSREALAGLVLAYPALGLHLSADLLAFAAARGGKV